MVDVNRIVLEFHLRVERTKKLGEMWPCAALCPTRLCLPAYPAQRSPLFILLFAIIIFSLPLP